MRTTSWLVIGISALLVLATSFAAARSVLANTEDPVVIDVEAAPGGVVIEVPAPTGEVFVADALSMELLEVQIDGVSPFGSSESTVSIDVAAVRYFPSRKVVSLEIRTAADATTNCTLQAVFNPTTQRWSYRCNASSSFLTFTLRNLVSCGDLNKTTQGLNSSPRAFGSQQP